MSESFQYLTKINISNLELISDTRERRSEIVTRVQKELESLKIEEERNNIELVLQPHDFDFHNTINSFVDGTSRKFADNWKLCARKKKQKHCVASTPKMLRKIDSSLSLTHLSPCKDLADRANRLLKEKQSDTIGHKKLARKCVNSKFLAGLRSVEFLLIC